MSELLNWGRNNGYSSTMRNSRSIIPGMQWDNQMPVMSNGMGGESGGSDWSWFDQTDADGMKTQGVAGLGLGAASSLFNGWLGMKKLGIARDELRENKRQFNMNWGAQKKTVNNQLHNDQEFRNSVNPDSQQVGKYMGKWGIE